MITKVAVVVGSESSGSFKKSFCVTSEDAGSRSVAARASIVRVFPSPIGSAMMPP